MARIIFAALLLLATTSWALAEHYVALTIGVDRYDNLPPDRNLKKAVGDAEAVSITLKKLGFDVVSGKNVDHHEFNRLWAEFLNRLQPDDVAIFDFSGHGVEIQGVNYLVLRDVPDVSTTGEQFLRDESIELNHLLEDLRAKKSRVSFLIIDACRNNPFGDRRGRSIGGTRDLAGIEAPKGSFVMYSAGLGQEALDRLSNADDNPNSVYTRTLLPLLATPGLSLSDIAKQVRGKVRDIALSVSHDQTPAYYDQMIGDYYPAGRIESAFSTPDPEQLKREAAAAAAECDRLAASPFDGIHQKNGIPLNQVDVMHAIPACRHAVATNPKTPRFKFQLARGLTQNGDTNEAHEWNERAANAGDPLAMLALSEIFLKGDGTEPDLALALTWSEKAAATGNAYALNYLGILYRDGRGAKRNYAKANDLFTKAAALGNADAMLGIGYAYAKGLGVTYNIQTAKAWFEKAAAQGNPIAIDNLAQMYATGQGAHKDLTRAKALHDEARAIKLGNLQKDAKN